MGFAKSPTSTNEAQGLKKLQTNRSIFEITGLASGSHFCIVEKCRGRSNATCESKVPQEGHKSYLLNFQLFDLTIKGREADVEELRRLLAILTDLI